VTTRPASNWNPIAVALWWTLGPAASAMPAGQAEAAASRGIKTEAEAQRALDQAAVEQRALQERYDAERARCANAFFATQCLDKARRSNAQGRERIHRIEVEAHDFQRQQAARERQAHRESEQARERAEPRRAKPVTKKDEGVANAIAPELTPQQAQAARERYEQRSAAHEQEQARRAEVLIRNRAANLQRFEEKRSKAKAYASDRGRAREENERDRAERERERKKKFEGVDETDRGPQAAP
jgi:colicin import membrane protein